MALSQQKFREIVFQLLFSYDFTGVEEEEMTEFMMGQFFVTKKAVREAEEKKKLVQAGLDKVDELIKRFCVSYDFDRIARAEKNILRLAVYEMCFGPSLPPKVAIAEAVRLTRKYATAESAGFVNAVLDAIFQNECKGHVHEDLSGLPIQVPV